MIFRQVSELFLCILGMLAPLAAAAIPPSPAAYGSSGVAEGFPTPLGPRLPIRGSEFGDAIERYLLCFSEDQSTGYCYALRALQARHYSDTCGDGTCGYIALFAGIYGLLKRGEGSVVYDRFFDVRGYDDPRIAVYEAMMNLDIERMLTRLKRELEQYDTPQEFLIYNKGDVVRAMRCIMLKHTLHVRDAKKDLLDARAARNGRYQLPRDCTDAQVDRLFGDVYISGSLADSADFANSEFWLTDTDINIYALIFNIDICTVVIDAENNVTTDALNKSPNLVFYDSDVLRNPMGAPFWAPRETVYLIIFVNHYYGVTE